MNRRIFATSENGRFRRDYAVLLVVLMAIGLWLRIRHLGNLSLLVDEGVQSLAVEAIHNHGVPLMESGLMYLRGPLYLYMQAAVTYIFDLNEFWLRIPSVIWGVAAIVPIYLLGKYLFGRQVGALAAVIIALSAWEVELSRYARVYIAFQFLFVVSLICFYRGFMLDERRFRLWFLVAAFFTFLTHELAQVLVTLFLIPVFSPSFTWARKLNFGGWAFGLGILLIVQRKFTGLRLPEGSSFPSEGSAAVGVVEQITRALGIPPLNGPDMTHFFQAIQYDLTAVVALALVAGVTTIYLLYQSWQEDRGWRILLGILMIWAAFAYQFGVVLIFFVAYLAIFARDRQILRDHILLAASGAAFICFAGWFIILANSSQLLLVEVPLTMFGFPAIYKYLFRWLIKGWPLVAFGLAVGSIALFARFIKNRHDTAALFLLGALYIPALFASLFESAFVPVYTLHLYPVIILIFAWAVWRIGTVVWSRFGRREQWSSRLAFLFGVSIILVVGADTNPLSAWEVTERTYQSEKPFARNIIPWRFYSDFHQDVKGPGRFVKTHMAEGDKVAVIGPDHTTQLFHYYIGNVDYTLTSKSKAVRYGVVRRGDLIHYTTGCEFIIEPSEMERLIQKHRGNLWLVGDRRILLESNPYHSDEEVKELVRSLSQDPDYIGKDGITFALKVQ
jgi:hypothetical protein